MILIYEDLDRARMKNRTHVVYMFTGVQIPQRKSSKESPPNDHCHFGSIRPSVDAFLRDGDDLRLLRELQELAGRSGNVVGGLPNIGPHNGKNDENEQQTFLIVGLQRAVLHLLLSLLHEQVCFTDTLYSQHRRFTQCLEYWL